MNNIMQHFQQWTCEVYDANSWRSNYRAIRILHLLFKQYTYIVVGVSTGTLDQEIFTSEIFYTVNFTVLFFANWQSGKNYLMVYNYNLELTLAKFQDCAVLELTVSFSSEEFATWHFISCVRHCFNQG